MFGRSKKHFYDGLIIDGQDVTTIFIVSAVVTFLVRLVLSWPLVVMLMIVFALFANYRAKLLSKEKNQGTDILASLAATSLVLVIYEYLVING